MGFWIVLIKTKRIYSNHMSDNPIFCHISSRSSLDCICDLSNWIQCVFADYIILNNILALFKSHKRHVRKLQVTWALHSTTCTWAAVNPAIGT